MTQSLMSASLERLAGCLPVFPGVTVADQLLSGRAAAERVLKTYVPDFSYDKANSERVMGEVDAWAERKGQALADEIDPAKNPGNTLPQQLSLDLGQGMAGQFMVALFTEAAAGLGPWASGEVARLASGNEKVSGTLVTTDWAANDADARLKCFGIIVALEQRGELAPIMSPQQTSGLGLPPAWAALIIISAVVAAAVVVAVVIDRHLARNNALMRDICEKAQADGRDRVVIECVNATKDLQTEGIGTAFVGSAIRAVAVIGVTFVGVRYGLPLLLERFGRGKQTH
jgi:hypothetical protein